MCHNSTTPIGVPPKSIPFDKQLSLAIDMVHSELDRYSWQRGLFAMWRRFCLRRQLRKLEAMVPR